jgi:hypothetical protein
MAMLGDILAATRQSATGVERWLSAERPNLHAAVTAAAHREGESVAAFVRATVADFADGADEEDWAALTSRLRAAEDPGAACLLAMLEWRFGAADEKFSPKDPEDAR